MFLGDAEFFLRTCHRIRLNPTDLRPLEREGFPTGDMTIEKRGSFACVGYLQRVLQCSFPFVWEKIGRTGEHGVLLFTIIQPAQHQAVGVWMRHDF